MYKINNKTLDVSKLREIAAGGEGRILEYSKDKVLKLYHQPRKAGFEAHLKRLSSLGKHFVVPQDVVYNGGGKVAGFTMDYVNFNDYWLFNNLFNKNFCNTNRVTRDFKVSVLQQLQGCIKEVHGLKLLVGDLNQYNIFVHKTKGSVLMVDIDSYASDVQPHSGVLIDDIRDWSTTGITEETDAWAYDILAFWTTCYVHPFKWVAKGDTTTLEQRVRNKKSILSIITNLKLPALYEPPTPTEKPQYEDIFNKGRRYMVDLGGTIVATPLIVRQQVVSASLQVQEVHHDVLRVHACNNYFTMEEKMGWVHYEANILRVARSIRSYQVDDLYPSDSASVVRRRGDDLYDQRDNVYTFYNPEFYYNDGSLSVLSANDIQTNYNLNNQMAGIENTQVPVFAKSVLYRGAPIQNFGAKKFLNIPVRASYTMVEVPFTTKDAFYCRGWWGAEFLTNRGATEWCISDGRTTIHLDHLAHFAVKGGVIFVPEDGTIDVYKDGANIARLDAPCTKSSQLYSTTAGILCLENNILYLLNTK